MQFAVKWCKTTDVILWTAVTWCSLKRLLSFGKKTPSQTKGLLAETRGPFSSCLILCWEYHEPAKAQPIEQKSLNNSTDMQSGRYFNILDPTFLWTLRKDQRRSFWNQSLAPLLRQSSVWSPVIVPMTGQTTNPAKTYYKVRRWENDNVTCGSALTRTAEKPLRCNPKHGAWHLWNPHARVERNERTKDNTPCNPVRGLRAWARTCMHVHSGGEGCFLCSIPADFHLFINPDSQA